MGVGFANRAEPTRTRSAKMSRRTGRLIHPRRRYYRKCEGVSNNEFNELAKVAKSNDFNDFNEIS